MEAAHFERAVRGGIAVAREMEETMNNVGEEFLAEGQAVSSMIGGGDGGADNDFTMGKGENIGRGRVAEVDLVEATTLAGGDENDANLSRKT